MIKQAICLCIDKNQYTFDFHKKQLQQVGIPLKLFIAGKGEILSREQYDHIDTNEIADTFTHIYNNRNRYYNVFLCHQKMIQIAKKQKLENVLLLEDDVILLNNFSFVIDKIIPVLNQMDWDTCYLGYSYPNMRQNNRIYQYQNKDIKISICPTPASNKFFHRAIGGFYCVLLNHTAYDKLLNIKPYRNMDTECAVHTKAIHVIPRIAHIFPAHDETNYEYHLLEGLDIDSIPMRK